MTIVRGSNRYYALVFLHDSVIALCYMKNPHMTGASRRDLIALPNAVNELLVI